MTVHSFLSDLNPNPNPLPAASYPFLNLKSARFSINVNRLQRCNETKGTNENLMVRTIKKKITLPISVSSPVPITMPRAFPAATFVPCHERNGVRRPQPSPLTTHLKHLPFFARDS